MEVAKASPVVELNLYYDPEFLHAMDAADGGVDATELIMNDSRRLARKCVRDGM